MKPKRNYRTTRANASMDDCQTPAYAVDPLIPYLPRGARLWEPAMGEGLLAAALAAWSYDVFGTSLEQGQNFYTYTPRRHWDILVTNPPWSLKFTWIARCYQLGKPWALLLPLETLGAAEAQMQFEQHGMELIVLDKRVDFKMPKKGWRGSSAQMPVGWFTHGLGLGRQIVYGKITRKF